MAATPHNHYMSAKMARLASLQIVALTSVGALNEEPLPWEGKQLGMDPDMVKAGVDKEYQYLEELKVGLEPPGVTGAGGASSSGGDLHVSSPIERSRLQSLTHPHRIWCHRVAWSRSWQTPQTCTRFH